jgi:hypothetical protein
MRNLRIHCCSMNRWSGLEVGDEADTTGGFPSGQHAMANFLEGRSKSLNSARLPQFKYDSVAL